MRSRAHFQSHPIHPALIPFPFAFLTGAAVFDVIGWLREDGSLWATAAHLTIAGLATGVLAAIPGAIDYRYTVPPNSSGRTRATRHAIGNVTALALFAIALLLRGSGWRPGAGTLVTELLGLLVLGYSGYLGGTLVSRNQISVDHRYAGAGKWQEATLSGKAGDPLVVGHADDLADDQMKLLHVNGHRIVLAKTQGRYCAFEDRCTHRGGSLAGGVLIDGTVQCLWHGSQFDVDTGDVRCGPARKGIRTYDLRQQDKGQLVLTSPPSAG